MTIWVDADACPVPVKEILSKAAKRAEITTIFIANHFISLANNPFTQLIQVEAGFDKADDAIVHRCEADDLVITNDIPLSAEVIEKGALVINHRGEKLGKSNIAARLTMRDFMETMRSSGEMTGGSAAFSHQDRQAFANQLDRYIAKHK